jgi:hypothetical protein
MEKALQGTQWFTITVWPYSPYPASVRASGSASYNVIATVPLLGTGERVHKIIIKTVHCVGSGMLH